MPTILQVAKEAGVSTGATSDILSGRFRYKYKPGTVEKVMAAAASLGYQANVAARILREQNKTLIGVAVPLHEYGRQSLARLVSTIFDTLRKEGFSPLQIESEQLVSNKFRVPFPSLDLLAGVLSADARMEDAVPDYYRVLQAKVPVVALYPTRAQEISYVTLNRHRVLEMAAEHLVGLGHKRIAVVATWKSDYLSDQLKVEQWPHIVRKHRLDPNPAYRIETPVLLQETFAEAAGGVAAQVMKMRPRPTALICMNGVIAMGVVRHLTSVGWKLPQDLSVMAYDYEAERYGSLFYPSLTCLYQPFEYIAEMAASHLVRLIRDAPEENLLAPLRMDVEPVLNVRESTAPLV